MSFFFIDIPFHYMCTSGKGHGNSSKSFFVFNTNEISGFGEPVPTYDNRRSYYFHELWYSDAYKEMLDFQGRNYDKR
jgi:hypothetical protein